MATEGRQSDIDLNKDHPLIHDAARYEFYQAVWQLSRLQNGCVPLGTTGPIGREPVLFEGNLSLGFMKSEIESARWVDSSSGELPQVRMMLNFMSMYGVSSPLPTYYTEEILEREFDERVARHFLDIFNHRFASLLFALWKKYRYFTQFQNSAEDELSKYLFSLIGLGRKAQRNSKDLDWQRLIPLSGMLGRRVANAATMETVVSRYFNEVPVTVEQFICQRVNIDHSQWNSLGKTNAWLGQDAFLGSSAIDAAGSFLLHIGPLSYDRYLEFLPTGKNYRALRELVSLMMTETMSYSVSIKVDATQVPRVQLSRNSTVGLGWATWLGRSRANYIEILQA
ncbi:MAG: type VI secretion system baseplate subunit TssG [Gammaproteobacteria bacterium]|nr:type VI secretion system baseplate subunit TssG [Gammaproteobacteria bacterium]